MTANISKFNRGLQDWEAGDAYSLSWKDGPHPHNGFVQVQKTNEPGAFNALLAPTSQEGDQEQFYGGTYSFDVLGTLKPYVELAIFASTRGGKVMAGSMMLEHSSSAWHHYVITLDEEHLHINRGPNTEKAVKALLSTIKGLYFKFEMAGSQQSVSMDNIGFMSADERQQPFGSAAHGFAHSGSESELHAGSGLTLAHAAGLHALADFTHLAL